MDTAELLTFLNKRKGLLDAVCVSGGEPTLHPGLESLLEQIKAIGYLVKLDTNGSRPDVLKKLVSAGLVDYVAMDVKNSPARYAQTVGLPQIDLQPIAESLAFLLSDAVDYELRTTVVAQMHDETSIREMAQWVSSLGGGSKAKRFFLQPFADRDSVLFSGLSAPSVEELEQFILCLKPFAEIAEIRGQ